MKYNVAFRVDANETIGSGHFMRCSLLAHALHEATQDLNEVSWQFDFFTDATNENLLENLPAGTRLFRTPRGGVQDDLAAYRFDSTIRGAASTTTSTTATATASVTFEPAYNLLVVDHYKLEAKWESKQRQPQNGVRRILAIDDLANRCHDCELLLDQNYFADAQTRYLNLVPQGCRTLLGPRYALIKSNFDFAGFERNFKPNTTSESLSLLCFLGAAPSPKAVEDIGRFLQNEKQSPLNQITFIVGSLFSGSISDLENKFPSIHWVRHIDEIESALASADIGLFAGGSIMWLAAALQLPSMLLAMTNLQEAPLAGLHTAGYFTYLGTPKIFTNQDSASPSYQGALTALRRFIESSEERMALGKRCGTLTDGSGKQTVVQELLALLSANN